MSGWVRALVLAVAATGLAVVGGAPATASDPGVSPVGAFDIAQSSKAGRIYVRGWAFDPEVPGEPVDIHVYVGGGAGDPAATGYNLGPANTYRPDVHTAYGTGDHHGFDFDFETRHTGRVPVHVYAINRGSAGANRYLGVLYVSVTSPDPIGGVRDALSPAHRTVTVRGLAIDQSDSALPVRVHAYVGGPRGTAGARGPYVGTADQPVPGTELRTGWYDHTFATDLGGRQPVHVYAINHAEGVDRELGSAVVDIVVDVTSPSSQITGGPTGTTSSTSPSFEFASPEPGVRFQCRWDGGSWEACTSPASRSLPAGTHTFAVRAIDPAGNVEDPAQTRSFTIVGTAVTPPVSPPGVPAPPVPPTVPGPEGSVVPLSVRAVRKGTRLRIDVHFPRDRRFVVQRKVGKKWRQVRRGAAGTRTGPVVLDLPRGVYRVVVPATEGIRKMTSRRVRLRA